MKRILFVDDETRILEGLQRMLRSHRQEWEMAFAPGGDAALTMLDAAPFDVIVSDMRMPGMDGAALLEIVRKKHPSVLRFILSGYTELEASYRAAPVAHQFLLKPCDSETLRTAISRATSIVEVLNNKMLAGLVGSMQDLPSLPRTYAAFQEALSDPESPMDRVIHIVEQDVAITAKILQLVNSAFFGVTRNISDIKTAVNYLGINVLQNLVLSVEVFRTFHPKKPIPGFSIEKFHAHSQFTARIASQIPSPQNPSSATIIAGLLHDVGKLVIAERSPDHLIRALQGAREEKRPLFSIEEDLIGVSHAEVGGYLLSTWGLPYTVVEAVAHHHHPERIPRKSMDLTAVVYLSNLLAHQHGDGAQEGEAFVESPIDAEIFTAIGEAEHLAEWQKMAELVGKEAQGV
jgi:putative nucleotidyltransferase with HDIG domain